MSANVAPRSFAARLLRTGLTIGVVDALWAVVLTLSYGRSITGLWQGVAAVPFGKAMLAGGASTALAGLAVHFGVAFWWSFVFLWTHTQSATVRSLASSGTGVALLSAVYGPLIWCIMSLVVIPTLTHVPTVITTRWVIQLFGHMVFVGLPIVWTVRRTA
ncbi:MAG: hypothetical protein ACYC7F_09860 [Gemmatimonadaceae bacterium]